MRHAVIAALSLAACTVPPVPVPAPADHACELAERRIRDLDCREDGKPVWRTPGGIPWAVVCRDLAVAGRDTRPDCVANLESCELLLPTINLAEDEPCVR